MFRLNQVAGSGDSSLSWSIGSKLGLSSFGLGNCGTWDPPGPGIEPVPPVLADGLFTIEPPGKPNRHFFK